MVSEITKTRAYSTLVTLAGDGRFPHAILIEGGALEEQELIAKKAAQMALCGEIRAKKEPCMSCKNCLKIEANNHPDIIIYEGSGGNKSFHIDAVREIRMSAYIKPNEAERKAYILMNAQEMTVAAQNALLKLIEEPPDTCIFILTCDNKSKLLTTILSRVTVIPLEGKNSATKEILEETETLIELISKGDSYECMKLLTKYERNRASYSELLTALKEALAEETRKIYSDNIENQRLRALQAIKIIDIIDRANEYLAQNINGGLLTAYISSQFKNALTEG